MGDKSAIEWTQATWNCLRGCTRVSEGCRFCYAMLIAARFSKPGQAYEGLAYFDNDGHPHWTGRVRLVEELLDQPLRWKRPRRIFVNSMSDLFHGSISDEDIWRVLWVMRKAHWHTFQVLTKRPDRMLELLRGTNNWGANIRLKQAWNNVWLGVSVEDQKTADERIPLLLETPAAVRWISAEPLLGNIDLSQWLATPVVCVTNKAISPDTAQAIKQLAQAAARRQGWATLNWVVAGGESGNHARPMHPAWAQSLRDQCAAAGVPFFFKQWGEFRECTPEEVETCQYTVAIEGHKECGYYCEMELGHIDHNHAFLRRVGKKEAGRLLDGRTWDEYPQQSTK